MDVVVGPALQKNMNSPKVVLCAVRALMGPDGVKRGRWHVIPRPTLAVR